MFSFMIDLGLLSICLWSLRIKSEASERFRLLVKKLNFPKIKLSEKLDNYADIILQDKKHLDNNPKLVSKKIIIELLKKINS